MELISFQKEFLFTGGITGMSLILLLAIIIGIIAIVELARRIVKAEFTVLDTRLMLSIKALGGIALMLGLFWQTLGLYYAFQAIKVAADISPIMVMNGVFMSFYSTLFGFGVCLVAYLIWYLLKVVFIKDEKQL